MTDHLSLPRYHLPTYCLLTYFVYHTYCCCLLGLIAIECDMMVMDHGTGDADDDESGC